MFECERHAVYDGGDHHMLVGHVLKASFDPSLDPLLYFRGSYRRLHFDQRGETERRYSTTSFPGGS